MDGLHYFSLRDGRRGEEAVIIKHYDVANRLDVGMLFMMYKEVHAVERNHLCRTNRFCDCQEGSNVFFRDESTFLVKQKSSWS